MRTAPDDSARVSASSAKSVVVDELTRPTGDALGERVHNESNIPPARHVVTEMKFNHDSGRGAAGEWRFHPAKPAERWPMTSCDAYL